MLTIGHLISLLTVLGGIEILIYSHIVFTKKGVKNTET